MTISTLFLTRAAAPWLLDGTRRHEAATRSFAGAQTALPGPAIMRAALRTLGTVAERRRTRVRGTRG